MAWISTAFRSAAVNMPVEVELLVPQPGYKSLTQTEDYKVIILLHGMNNDRTEWLLKSQIFDMVKEEPVLVCMPSGKNSFYVNTANGYDYMDYITKELPAWLKTMFRVSERKEDWLIAGESMGGYGAMVCGLNATEQFGSIAAFSGALDIVHLSGANPAAPMELIFGENWREGIQENYEVYGYSRKIPKEQRPRLYLCCGKQDSLFDMNKRFMEEVKDEYDVTWSEGDGAHDFLYWNERLKEVLSWFLKKEVYA